MPAKTLPGESGSAGEYQVFISHSSEDSRLANSIREVLEAAGVRCWIAPRDIPPGRDWAEAIIQGIESCRILLMIWTERSNRSGPVAREVERALGKGLVVVPLRVENVHASKSLEYCLSMTHWLDATAPPVESHFRRVVESVLNHLRVVRELETSGAIPLPVATATTYVPDPGEGAAAASLRSIFRLVAVALGIAAGVIAGGLVWTFQQEYGEPDFSALTSDTVFFEFAFNFVRLAPIAVILGIAGPAFFGRYAQAVLAVGIAMIAVGCTALAQIFMIRLFYPAEGEGDLNFLAPEIMTWTLDGSLLLIASAIAAGSPGRTLATFSAGCICGAICGGIMWALFTAILDPEYFKVYSFYGSLILGSLCGIGLSAVELFREYLRLSETRRRLASRFDSE